MAAWYVSLFLVTRNMRPTLMKRNMRSSQNINICCGSAGLRKAAFFVLSAIGIPCIFVMNDLLSWWLGGVPEHAVLFCVMMWRKRSMSTHSKRFNPPTFEPENGLKTA